MIAKTTKQRLGELARQICIENNLSQVYFVQVLGSRRHYLIGFGKTLFSKPEHMAVGKHLALFWHGSLSKSKREQIRNIVEPFLDALEQELQHKSRL
ncbi:MAG: hypothetical protein JXD19_06030 [Deltaproteobacteria bacterium]|nr:hypothetical protein [Deltaproteobacteria bacterium]